MKLKYGAVIAAGLVHSVSAAELSYTTLELGYQSADVTVFEQNRTFTGLFLSGRYQFNQAAYVFIRADQLTNSDFNFEPSVSSLNVGIGYFMPVSMNSDVFFGIGYGQSTIEFGRLVDSELDGIAVNGGFRTQLAHRVELEGDVSNVHLDGETNTTVSLASRYYVTAAVSPEIRVSRSDNAQAVSLGLQLRF